ncbi:hypothetical protein XENTR_v10004981 [Xenopus tropicalis]|nr:hypothetical protein XENTR_v10004981 [Xenopus tropicalis]
MLCKNQRENSPHITRLCCVKSWVTSGKFFYTVFLPLELRSNNSIKFGVWTAPKGTTSDKATDPQATYDHSHPSY